MIHKVQTSWETLLTKTIQTKLNGIKSVLWISSDISGTLSPVITNIWPSNVCEHWSNMQVLAWCIPTNKINIYCDKFSRTVHYLQCHLLPEFPFSTPSPFPTSVLCGRSAGVGASMAGLRCSLSWAGWGDGEDRMRKRKEREKILYPRQPKRGSSKTRKQTRTFVQVKQTNKKDKTAFPHPSFYTSPIFSFPFFLSHPFSPGRGLARLGLNAICCIM